MKTTVRTRLPRSKILILTGSIGAGHLSVARAIADEIGRKSQGHVDVEIVDFITQLENFLTTATKKFYLNSLKLSPKIYEMFFTHSADSTWPIKLLNLMSIPFLESKFEKLMNNKKPDLIVSTFPVWDLLIKKIWKKYNAKLGRPAPFVSVVTDSISIHSVWTLGDPDFYFVPNEDTKITLQNYGVSQEKIKVFGYPIAKRFFQPVSKLDLEKKWNLSPKRKTLLLILSTGVRWSRVKEITEAIQKSNLKNLQLMIVATASPSWAKKLGKIKWKLPVHITGWTNEMHTLIQGADIVLTKAGGATVMECITCQKPIVIIEAIPGQEIGNAMLVQKYNLGVVLNRDLSDFDRAISYILKNEALIKKNLGALRRPEASKEIAQFLLMLVAGNH